MSPNSARPWPAPPIILLALLGVLLAVRVVALLVSRTDLFFDEAQYWFWSRELAFGYFSKPPMIAWVIRATTALCGDGEACVRVAAPILHTLTALLVFVLGALLYSRRVGVWAALGFATLPGISFSAGLITTDVPLLLFWAGALVALVRLWQGGGWGWAMLLGACLGLGLLSKYAMGYFALCLLLWLAWAPRARRRFDAGKLAAAAALGLAILSPNIAWNAANGFATLHHTAANAKLDGPLFSIANALGFAAAQFAVMGPIFLALLVAAAWHAMRRSISDREKLLIAFSLPVVLLVTGQAFLSRAHANWAAPAYVAGTVLVVAGLLEVRRRGLLRGIVLAHAALIPLLAIGGALAGRLMLPMADPYVRVLGWQALADAAAEEAARIGARVVAADKRSLAAELSYYLRDRPLEVRAWHGDGPPRDHFEMMRPLAAGAPEPVLFVSLDDDISEVAAAFSTVARLGRRAISAGTASSRDVTFFRLSGRKPDGAAR